MDTLITIFTTLTIISPAVLSFLGISGGYRNRQSLGLWILYATIVLALTGAFLHFQKSIWEEQSVADKFKTVQPDRVPPQTRIDITEARQAGEKMARDSEAATRAQLAEFPGNIRFLWMEYPKALAQELASLTPEQRAAQAYCSMDWKTAKRPSGLLSAGSPKAQPVFSPNTDFFNPALPRTAIQVIVLLGISSTDRVPAHPEKANPAVVRRFEVRQTLDWSRIAAMVE